MGENRFKMEVDDNDCVSGGPRSKPMPLGQFTSHTARPESGKIFENAQNEFKGEEFTQKNSDFMD